MLLQVPKINFSSGLAECFPALIALVRHLVLRCMNVSVVFYQAGLGTKTLTAIVALEWLLPCMDPLVDLEQRYMREPLGAEGAGVGEG